MYNHHDAAHVTEKTLAMHGQKNVVLLNHIGLGDCLDYGDRLRYFSCKRAPFFAAVFFTNKAYS